MIIRETKKGNILVEWHDNSSKKAAKEVYKSNGYIVSDVIQEADLIKILEDVTHKQHFLVVDLKGNGIF
jgi:hypothetical protein